ncbi:hypothetical protein BDZ89DRAFT_211194 [Hymenopellis radicata]|nr:hypothetical protein BDZ89DRAFT_211194 [Hymenopellis radicata]
MSTLTESEPRDRDDLASYFNRSAYVVHSYADRLEHGYARPAIKTAKELFQEHPIPFVFFCFFSVLSIFPILLFLFVSVLVTLSFVFFALSSALLASAGFLFTASCLLLLVLSTNLCISTFPTVALFWSYTVLRLISLTRAGGRAGAAQWVDETKTFVGSGLGFKSAPKTEDTVNASPRSEGSIVLVDERVNVKQVPSQDPEKGVKVED